MHCRAQECFSRSRVYPKRRPVVVIGLKTADGLDWPMGLDVSRTNHRLWIPHEIQALSHCHSHLTETRCLLWYQLVPVLRAAVLDHSLTVQLVRPVRQRVTKGIEYGFCGPLDGHSVTLVACICLHVAGYMTFNSNGRLRRRQVHLNIVE